MDRHELKLHPQPFKLIAVGKKVIELRLNDEKRQQIKIGDTLIFKKRPDLTEQLVAKVIDLYHYQSFNELLNNFDPSEFGLNTTEEVLKQFREFYPNEIELKNGVLGIRFKI